MDDISELILTAARAPDKATWLQAGLATSWLGYKLAWLLFAIGVLNGQFKWNR
ncbi:TPA: hypothetical protein ACPZRZ_003966 [Yersinia enterocolitica]|uniref:hypothetical protein n=1 Tax=Yersinia enterocolitica TaxID=630 RepID=UPI0028B933F0|nr:hypothetical protein [Yersinia enterocolitica]ELW7355822.1 hypothetical protein [Yersinia enterocolitica]ELX2282869.1 hypothetical protein [Yersinia enterocolitica]EMA2896562.1 hypothetical protein [Yersinia enterocolitica]EMB6581707.1 hypothetical protein [Yersinia enterocolitica]